VPLGRKGISTLRGDLAEDLGNYFAELCSKHTYRRGSQARPNSDHRFFWFLLRVDRQTPRGTSEGAWRLSYLIKKIRATPTARRAFSAIYDQIADAEWHVLSAGRAVKLLLELLFDRVHALSVGGFRNNFPTAEVDIHFSLSKDMVTLSAFLTTLRVDGPVTVTHRLTSHDW
jgi:hypothetical protein